MLSIMAIFGSVGRASPMQVTSAKCEVVGNPHGVRNGWFMHPMNFDPVWLESCSGFTPKAERK